MHSDIRGVPITAASTEAVQAFDHALDGYLSYRSDVAAQDGTAVRRRSGVRNGACPQRLSGDAFLQAPVVADRSKPRPPPPIRSFSVPPRESRPIIWP